MLRAKFFTPQQVEAIVRDYRSAGLSPAEVAMMGFAEKIALHAYKVTQDDIDTLRAHEFSDEEILDIAMTASARSFFSKAMDSVGAEPDAEYLALDESLRHTLTVGRPFGPPRPKAGLTA